MSWNLKWFIFELFLTGFVNGFLNKTVCLKMWFYAVSKMLYLTLTLCLSLSSQQMAFFPICIVPCLCLPVSLNPKSKTSQNSMQNLKLKRKIIYWLNGHFSLIFQIICQIEARQRFLPYHGLHILVPVVGGVWCGSDQILIHLRTIYTLWQIKWHTIQLNGSVQTQEITFLS